ncbi:hypothetical protein PG2048B_0808 [Bifidobacterium pseudolongum subsp. globosum]|uniref:hypothetical protein n=1 Tax=Bifidobacterium pseudolongum TaxID=1694 RepID=UPI001020C2E2|nr:hypothetical protein [Bifidobacterium pseudolongum]RYQ24506.1 hypothetical protein PG2048B_0808 [Bifidobacterium pseudolongum subsp. globosum]
MSEPRNLHPDPRCLRVRNMWRATSTIVVEKRQYTLADGAPTGSVFVWTPLTNEQLAGNILYARINAAQDVLDKLNVEGAPVVAKQGEWIAASSPAATNRTIAVTNGPFTLCEVGVYTPEDWEKLYAAYQAGDIPYPWCAGPRNATMAGEKGPWEL